MSFGDAVIIAISGIAVVFMMLCILWASMVLIDKFVSFTESFEKVAEPTQKVPEAAKQFAFGEMRDETWDRPIQKVVGTFVPHESEKKFAFGEMRDDSWDRPIQKVLGIFTPKPKAEKKEVSQPAPAPEPTPAPAAPAPAVEGTFGGDILLFDVDDKTAACLMAIVADQTKIPLNELIFKSIRALD